MTVKEFLYERASHEHDSETVSEVESFARMISESLPKDDDGSVNYHALGQKVRDKLFARDLSNPSALLDSFSAVLLSKLPAFKAAKGSLASAAVDFALGAGLPETIAQFVGGLDERS